MPLTKVKAVVVELAVGAFPAGQQAAGGVEEGLLVGGLELGRLGRVERRLGPSGRASGPARRSPGRPCKPGRWRRRPRGRS